jgi:hypothetical protein
MRSRILKPGFFKNEELAECDPLARILFAGLWGYADREGRFEWRPKRIKAEILPYDKCDIKVLLQQLVQGGFIHPYSVNGKDYGYVPTFHQHQNPHRRESQSKLPPCQKDEPGTGPGVAKDGPRLPVSNSNSNSNSNIKTLCPSSIAIESAQLLKLKIKKELPNARLPTDKAIIEGRNSWSNIVDRMIRIDNRDPQEIQDTINWLYSPTNLDAEARFVVQSAQALREKYDRIQVQVKKGKPRRVESPTKAKECKRCQSWWTTMVLNEEGYCERCAAIPRSA